MLTPKPDMKMEEGFVSETGEYFWKKKGMPSENSQTMGRALGCLVFVFIITL